MKYSKKKYFDYMLRTLDALFDTNTNSKTFINNPGFGNIFDILKNESYKEPFVKKLEEHFGPSYADTVLKSLQKGSLNSFYTPKPIISSIRTFLGNQSHLKPKHILEPSAGNGLIIRDLMTLYPNANFTAFEKDILTTRILEHNFKGHENITIFGVPFESFDQTQAVKEYDLVISNIPFGANKVFDPSLSSHPLYSEITKNIHSYFIHKSLQHLKPAGICLLLCTKNFMDKKRYVTIRKDLVKTNNFIGGVRLPDTAFAQENTAVVTDILVFQNNRELSISKEQKEINSLFTESSDMEVGENSVQFSSYFKHFPKHVLGELVEGGLYDSKDYTIKGQSDIDLLTLAINKTMQNLVTQEAGLIKEQQLVFDPQIPIVDKPDPPAQNQPIPERSKTAGNLVVHQQKIAKYTPDLELEFLKVKPKDFDKLSKIIALRDTYLEYLQKDNPNTARALENLNYQYDMFVFQYGNLNHKSNYHFVTLDIQGPLLLGLEKPQNGVFRKSDLLVGEKKTVEQAVPKQPAHLNLQDAIYYSLNKFNRVDATTLAELTGKQEGEIVRKALQEQLLFVNPESEKVELAPKFLFLSGEIHKKIEFYKKNNFGEFQSYIDKEYSTAALRELEKIKPPITPFEDLDVKIHEPWFSIKITQTFIYDTYKTFAHIAYNESTSKYMVKIESYDYHLMKQFHVNSEHRNYNFKQILEGALNSTIPYVTKGSGSYKRTDKVKMKEIKMKFDLLYKEFNAYIHKKPKLKQQLEWTFYTMYDANVHPKYDGTYLKFEGLQGFEPYDSQKDTVAGIVINQGLLVNKEVGFGKTLDMALTSQKLHELNLSKKTLVIGIKSTLVQLEREFRNAFPNMTLMVAHDKLVQGIINREAFFKKVVNSQVQVVLMSHDTFKFIPQSPEIIQNIIQEELDNLERDLGVIYQDKYSINKRELKGLELRKENLEATLKTLFHEINTKQTSPFQFDQMGFEHIMVDESHIFKNLMYTTRHNRVAGLNTSKGSDRSKNLLTAIRTLQQKKGSDFQATFLSGTPISNSITEVYVLFKYLIPNRLKQMNITSFDQWAQVFANKTYEFEPTVAGDYKVRERFRSFKKMKLLSSLYNEISIIVNAQTHPIDRPKMEVDIHAIKPTKGQLAYFEKIKEFLKTGKSELLYGNKNYNEDQKTALSLIGLHHMRYASIDPRLLEPNLPFDEETKLWHVATQVYLTYCETNYFKGTQAIFSDIGVPKDTFNVYNQLKRILTEGFDVPEDEVVFIHDFKTDKKRAECFKKVNSGTYRIIIGSTQKLGTGTNIQERLCRIHHVDIPYRPTDIDQRNGRGVRKGNIWAKKEFGNKVIVSFYVVENSTDALMLNHVNTKKNFIEQITNGTIQFNKLDMGPIGEQGTIDYKTLLAVSKNDPIFLEKEELSKTLDELLLEHNIFKRNKREAQSSINFYSDELKLAQKNVEKLNKDLPLWESISDIDTYFAQLAIATGMPKYAKPKQIGEGLSKILNSLRGVSGEHQVVKLESAALVLKVTNKEQHDLYVRTDNASYGYGFRQVTKNKIGVAEYMHKALSKIPIALKEQNSWVKEYSEAISGSQKIINQQFEKEDELQKVEQRLAEIHKWLDDKYDAEPEKEEEKTKEASLDKSANVGIIPS